MNGFQDAQLHLGLDNWDDGLGDTGINPDLMEVENEKYHEKVSLVLPLSSGRFAVLTPDRRLYKVVGSVEEAVHLGPAAHEAMRRTWKKEHLPTAVLVGDDLLKELGL